MSQCQTPGTNKTPGTNNKSIMTIRRYCREGRFTGAVKRGREWIIPGEGIIEYLTAEEKERVKKWIKKKY